MKRLSHLLICLLVCLFPVTSIAQDNGDEDGGGFLTRTIEGALSGAGRDVQIRGFRGALSSEASFDSMTIADDSGVWLTLEDVTLNWSRAALLRGRLQVDRLSAASLELPRLPEAGETEELPAAEATGFALPELPVSINIEAFEVERIVLGAPLLGEETVLQVQASARLDDDGLQLDLTADRLDGAAGRFGLRAGFARETEIVLLDLDLSEEAGGIASHLLSLPGDPSVDLTVAGEGPLDDFTTDIRLATDDAPRMEGQVRLTALAPATEGAAPDRRIVADIGGDITAVLAPEYRDFFGTDVGLTADTLIEAAGAISVDSFALRAEAAQLQGRVRINEDGWPAFIDVDGQIGRGGAPVVLPGTDAGTTISAVTLSVDFDAGNGDALKGAFDIRDLVQKDVRIDRTLLSLDGTLEGTPGSIGQLLTDLDLAATGIELNDPDVARALGDSITGRAEINYIEDQPIRISDLNLGGEDYALDGDIIIRGLGDGFPTRLDLTVQAEDLTRFAPLAGQDLSGAADLTVAGMITPLAGTFDLRIAGNTQDIGVGISQADSVMAGQTELSLRALRDQSGTFVENLLLRNAALDVAADASLQSGNSSVRGRAALSDVALVLPQYEGPVIIVADATQDARGWSVDGGIDAPYDGRVTVNGLVTGPDADMTVTVRLPEISALVPQVSGPLDAAARIWQAESGYRVDATAGGPFGADVVVKGLATGPDAAVDFVLDLPDIGVLVPEIRGPLNLTGRAARAGEDWRVDTDVRGPSGTQANVAGTVAQDGNLDLAVAGALPLGLAQPFLAPRSLLGEAQFDLALRGAPGLSAVSGRITTSDATFTAPNLRLGLTGLDTTVAFNNGTAQIDLGGDVVSGGRIEASGSLGLGGSLPADLEILLRNTVLTDPRLYTTTLNGAIGIDGPLSGGARITGQINIGETTISVPSTGLTSIGDIPPIAHVGAPREVNVTRQRADVVPQTQSDGQSAGSGGAVYGLGIQVNAPGRIFVRGRGLDAELGGGLEITGNTARIISAGEFNLIRGRLDILAKRFDLTEGTVQFLGGLTPYIRFVTTSTTRDGTASIVLEGAADDLEVSFVSDPAAPEDEVLAQLLFGRSLSQLSAFQALQLANAVATVAGRSGIGLIGQLRQGFGLDDFDITTNDDGETEVRAGKYISDNVYTDVTSSGGDSEISLNIDLTDSFTARGSVDGNGNTGVGIFFERDY
ncbi:translocation/assembly module TamB domain-containing protein [uncultured Roseobacter sp.]|uniref:translocation/assembly module TamB domain-containing protein n=1 Tax=uncultured Roseobacter sp. TaxID=114847 RepID=UPI002615D7B5|nr:translocation/assembly module TamB domain-containing protein [uncultured Roseobacter sp.]